MNVNEQLLFEIRKIREALEGINLRLRVYYEDDKYVNNPKFNPKFDNEFER